MQRCPSLTAVTSKPTGSPLPSQGWKKEEQARTDAGGDGGAALLVALGTAVAGDARHSILAGTLASGLVAGLASSTHGVAITSCEGHTTRKSEGSLPTQE